MRVLRIIAEGPVTSFRYPHFVQGVHPTYEMPPPATIYGHVCSAVGELIPPDMTKFAYLFTYTAKFWDYEHLHFPQASKANQRMRPFVRELLFKPRLTLYLSNCDLEPYFLRPRYPVVLGRSQDLMTYLSVKILELEPAELATFGPTLLPLQYAAPIGGRTYAVTMPRYIDEDRVPHWDQYAVLCEPIVYPGEGSLRFEDNPISILVDPNKDAEAPRFPDVKRGVVWLEWK